VSRCVVVVVSAAADAPMRRVEPELTCPAAQDVSDIVHAGLKYRAIASTMMNIASSRSHCVLTIHLSQKFKDGSTYVAESAAGCWRVPACMCAHCCRVHLNSKNGHMNLVDLAGSERVGRSGASGATLEEAKSINQSLSALGNCIQALSTSGRSHIPYRNSKLTHLLKESIGGNCKTFLVITASLAIVRISGHALAALGHLTCYEWDWSGRRG